MDILVVGGGGREHAIVRKLRESKRAGKIYCAPGNGGISMDAECVNVNAMDKEGMLALAREKAVDLVFVAPDDPLGAGMVDYLEAGGFQCFGPNAKAAEIESSKVFSKNLMKKYGIPTAQYEVFTSPGDALAYIKAQGKYPAVVKADGLAVGKGVTIAQNEQEAAAAIHSLMEEKIFGDSGSQVVIEEFLTGPEVSVLAFTDGHVVRPMVSSMDHKRAFDGDQGPNTGGMGTISPNPYYTDEIATRCMEEIFLPTISAMNAEGRKFKGCLYFGLMLTPNGPKVIEYNCRFGDPETQVVLPRLKTDFLDIIDAVIDERLEDLSIQWSEEACACVILASGGYPGSYPKGKEITGLNENGQAPGATVIHAGTKHENGKFYTNGGRVLGVTALGSSLDKALDNAYTAVEGIHFEGCFYRKDIGRTGEKDCKIMLTPASTWENVLLTDSGFFDPFDLSRPLVPIVERFQQMVRKPFAQARVLFIPAAACDEEAKTLADILHTELLWLGFLEKNITTYLLDAPLADNSVLSYDVMLFTGGWCEHLLNLVKQLNFEEQIKAFVYAGKTYVGVSAGSVLATPNIMGTFEQFPSPRTSGLGFLHAYLDCHCDMQPDLTEKKLPLPHIMLHFNQALAVSSTGYELLEDPTAHHEIDWASPPVMGVDVFRKDSGLRTGSVR